MANKLSPLADHECVSDMGSRHVIVEMTWIDHPHKKVAGVNIFALKDLLNVHHHLQEIHIIKGT